MAQAREYPVLANRFWTFVGPRARLQVPPIDGDLKIITYYEIYVVQSVCYLSTDWTIGILSQTEEEDFSSNLCVQTGSGAHPASCTVGTGVKARPGRDVDHSPPSCAKVKKK
jgi:hypothetical protein